MAKEQNSGNLTPKFIFLISVIGIIGFIATVVIGLVLIYRITPSGTGIEATVDPSKKEVRVATITSNPSAVSKQEAEKVVYQLLKGWEKRDWSLMSTVLADKFNAANELYENDQTNRPCNLRCYQQKREDTFAQQKEIKIKNPKTLDYKPLKKGGAELYVSFDFESIPKDPQKGESYKSNGTQIFTIENIGGSIKITEQRYRQNSNDR
jgi:hypothetical protein